MNPLSNGLVKQKQNRPLVSLYLVTLRKRIEEALSNVFNKQTLKVHVQNQRNYDKQLQKVSDTILQAQKILSKDIKDGADRKNVVEALESVRKAVEEIPSPDFTQLSESLKSVEVAVKNIVIPEVSNKEVVSALLEIKKTLSVLPKQFPKPEKVVIPEPKEFPSSMSLQESQAILSALSDLKDEIGKLPKSYPKQQPTKIDLEPLMERLEAVEKAVENINFPEVDFPKTISVDNFPPQRLPTPVTSVFINSLRGPVLATQVTVEATATAVPASSLDQRRSLIIFNNSSSVVYLGDRNVNDEDGFPVPANQYSPPMDLGDNVELYAIVSSGTADVRIFEVSMDDQGA